jgi:hypothetical protein
MIIYRMICDPETMAKGVPFSTAESITTTFRDGRPSAFLLQPLVAIIYNYTETVGNARGHDFTSAHNLKVELKCLTKSVYFRESGNTGKNRTCTAVDVTRFIKNLDAIVVVDVLGFPVYDCVKLTGSTVMEWYYKGYINPTNGNMPRKKFYQCLQLDEPLEIKMVDRRIASALHSQCAPTTPLGI